MAEDLTACSTAPCASDEKAPFIFVSYAHKDAHIVFPTIDSVSANGYKIWYDKGIGVSTTWTDEIGEAIKNCAVFLVFITKNSAHSEFVRREIEFASNVVHKDIIIPVYLDGMEVLPSGLGLTLSGKQGIMYEKTPMGIVPQILKTLANKGVPKEGEIDDKWREKLDLRSKKHKNKSLLMKISAAAAILAVLFAAYLLLFAAEQPVPLDNEAFISLSRTGTAQEIENALRVGANVNARDFYGRTALLTAARYNEDPRVIPALLENGANVNARDSAGWTALMTATIHNENPEVIVTLLENGADTNVQFPLGGTALFFAAQRRSPELIRAFIDSGADVNASDTFGNTPLMGAAHHNSNPEVILALVENGADVNARAQNGTALMRAAEHNNNPEVIFALIESGANANVSGFFGTALMLAARHNSNPEIIKALIESGADVNARNSSLLPGQTPLMMAARNNSNPEVILVLLENGADAGLRDFSRFMAIDHARRNENVDMVNTEAYRRLSELSR